MPVMIWLTWYLAFLCLLAMVWYPCCCAQAEVECQYCTGEGNNAACFSLTVSGIANDGCDECGSINGTYIMEFNAFSAGTHCEWLDYTGGTACDEVYNFVLRLYGPTYGQIWFVRLVHKPELSENLYDWEVAYEDAPDCLSISGLSIPYSDETINSPSTSCDASGATVTITTATCP